MLLAIDVGNTQIVLGLMEGRRCLQCFRLSTDAERSPDEYALYIHNLLQLPSVRDLPRPTAAILSTVVPKLRQTLQTAVQQCLGLEMPSVGPGMRTGLSIRMDNPRELGADLVVDAVAALDLAQPPLLIIDIGTATTFSYIEAQGHYQGGLIIPGPGLSLDALVARAAQLRKVELDPPPSLIGKNTVQCMQAGLLYSQAAMLDGLIQRFQEELGQPLQVIATGGLAPSILPLCQQPIRHEAQLTLYGLALIHERQKNGEAERKNPA